MRRLRNIFFFYQYEYIQYIQVFSSEAVYVV